MIITVGMSGGVDSTMTAALLREAGHTVIGVTMSVYKEGLSVKSDASLNVCYSPAQEEKLNEVQRIADQLGIEHHIISVEEDFQSIILDYYRSEYAAGRTPNPCVVCNTRIKFGVFLEKIEQQGIPFDRIATGHYARILSDPETGMFSLHNARDLSKDQTYFLHRLSRKALSRLLFPLGDYLKEEVREMARSRGFPVHDKKDSKGFYAGDYRDLLQFEPEPGPIVDTKGNYYKDHNGIWNYTIGQRRGLDLNLPGNRSMYVSRLDRTNNTVIIGNKEDIYHTHFLIDSIHWIKGESPLPAAFEIKVGNTHPRARAHVEQTDEDVALVVFEQKQPAVAPGQYAVFYSGDEVFGGGVIVRVLNHH